MSEANSWIRKRLFNLLNVMDARGSALGLKIVGLCLAGLILFGAVSLIDRLLGAFAESSKAMAELAEQHAGAFGGPLTRDLFRELYGKGIITFDAQAARIDLKYDCRAAAEGFPIDLRDRKRIPVDPDAAAEDDRAKRRLCRTDLGATIRKQIVEWNARSEVVAVRDDRDAGELTCDDRHPWTFYLPQNCHAAAWQADFIVAPGETGAATAVDNVDPPADLLGFLAQGFHPGFGDWQRFDASTPQTPGSAFVLSTELKGRDQARRVTVDVLGEVVNATWSAKGAATPPTPASHIEMRCQGHSSDERCRAAAGGKEGAHLPRGYRLTFDVTAPGSVVLRIEVRPIAAVANRVAALGRAIVSQTTPLTDSAAKGGDAAAKGGDAAARSALIHLTNSIVVTCDHVDPEALASDDATGEILWQPGVPAGSSEPLTRVCALDWLDALPGAPPVPTSPPSLEAGSGGALEAGTLDVRTAEPDSEPLTEVQRPAPTPQQPNPPARVIASKATRQLGLLPVVGLDDADSGSLLGQLRHAVPAGQERVLSLTLDSGLQAASFDVLAGLMRREPLFAKINEHLAQADQDVRRGAIVLIDAGAAGPPGSGFDQNTGRILAAATWPQVAPGLSEWDLRALDQYQAAQSPLAARGWSGNDRLSAPGSTIKPFIALAAIDRAARGDDRIAEMLGAEPERKGLDAAGISRVLGHGYNFSYDTSELYVPVLRGASKIGDDWPIGTESGAICNDVYPGRCASKAPLRLNDMLAKSDNIWFARLALALDEDAVSVLRAPNQRIEITDDAGAYGEGPVKRLAIAAMVQRLWPPAEAAQILPDDHVGRFSRVSATPIQLEETLPNLPRRLQSVAFNGIGQRAQATPLAMASMTASLATGRIVLPRLTDGLGLDRPSHGAPLLDPEPVDGKALDQARADTMIDALRTAMVNVIKYGTAATAFAEAPDLRERLHGKTGTAQTTEREGDSVWFEGWLDGLERPGFKDRRIAFACMLTHVEQDHAAGGSSCAPLIRILLHRLEGKDEAHVAVPPPQKPPAPQAKPIRGAR